MADINVFLGKSADDLRSSSCSSILHRLLGPISSYVQALKVEVSRSVLHDLATYGPCKTQGLEYIRAV